MIKVKISGGKGIDRELRKLGFNVARGMVTKIALKSLQPFAEKANELAPDSGSVRDGKLNASYRVGRRSVLTKAARKTAPTPRSNEVIVHAGTSNIAGVYQEFGTVDFPPQPHARPAWEATRAGVLAYLLDSMRRNVFARVARLKPKK